MNKKKILFLVSLSFLFILLININTKFNFDSKLNYTLVTAQKIQNIFLFNQNGEIEHVWNLPNNCKTDGIAYFNIDHNLLANAKCDHPKNESIFILDKNSKILKSVFNTKFHHEVFELKNNNYLGFHYARISDKRLKPQSTTDDLIVIKNDKSELLFKWSTINGLNDISKLLNLKFPIKENSFEKKNRWSHGNRAQEIPHNKLSSDPRFKAGNILLSYRNLNTIAILDRETLKIIWAWGPDEIELQHYPTMLESGNILIYDNGAKRGYSRIVEMNPKTRKIVWKYDVGSSFFSPARGSVIRMNDTSTVITHPSGKVFSVDLSGKTLWEIDTFALIKSFYKRKSIKIEKSKYIDSYGLDDFLYRSQSYSGKYLNYIFN